MTDAGRPDREEGSVAGGLLRSMAVIGGASALSVLIGIVRVKLLALLVGPVGVGLFGVLNNLYDSGLKLAGLGLAGAAVRDFAAAPDAQAQARIRRSLILASLTQAALAALIVWAARAPLARLMFEDDARALETGLVGVAIAFGLVYTAQHAALQGLRRIGDIARVTVFGAAILTVTGLVAVWAFGINGVVALVLLQPAITLALAAFYARRIGWTPVEAEAARVHVARLRAMLPLGAAMMGGALLVSLSLLLTRSMLIRSDGLEAAGWLQASWSISMQYLGFILGAMAADYYPRLSGVIDDRPVAARLVNEQAQIALAVGGPVLLALTGAAPWVIPLLYAKGFEPAAGLLQWQSLGNVLKLAGWSLGFILLARQRPGLVLLSDLAWNALFLTVIWLSLPMLGVEAVGIAFALAYALYLPLVGAMARRVQGFVWAAPALRLIAVHAGLAAAVLALSRVSALAGAAAGLAAAAATGLWGLRMVVAALAPQSRVGRLAAQIFRRIGWPLPEQAS